MNSKYEAALADYVKFNFTEGPWNAPSIAVGRALR